jgi:ketosteroid isomerase-like protein
VDKQAIYEVICQYCRALDRMDKKLAYSVWHDDGTALYHDMYEGTGHGFVDWVWEAHAAMERHSHQVANHLIIVDGDTARSETYVTVVLWTNPDADGKQQEIVGRGRYLDQWSRRGGRWAISHREHVLDLQTVHELNKGFVSSLSARDDCDPSFSIIPKA